MTTAGVVTLNSQGRAILARRNSRTSKKITLRYRDIYRKMRITRARLPAVFRDLQRRQRPHTRLDNFRRDVHRTIDVHPARRPGHLGLFLDRLKRRHLSSPAISVNDVIRAIPVLVEQIALNVLRIPRNDQQIASRGDCIAARASSDPSRLLR